MSVTMIEPTKIDTPATRAIMLDCGCGTDGIMEAMEAGYRDLVEDAERYGVTCVGSPRAVYRSYGKDGVKFTLAIPVMGGGTVRGGKARIGELPAARSLRFTHQGPYEELMRTYGAVTTWMVDHHFMSSESDWDRYMPMWEEYVSDPATTAPADLVTFIHLPLRDRPAG